MGAVFSQRWFRVAALKPSLTAQLQLTRQRIRGQTWMLLSLPGAARSVRLNAAAYAIAARFDGLRSVQQLWDAALQRDADAVTQDEFIDLLAQLREASLLHFDRGADFELLLPHLERLARPARASLLAWRVPLANPSRLLDRLRPLQGVLFSHAAGVLWLLAVLALALLALQHAPALWSQAQQSLGTPRFALLALLLYVPIKLLHELAHGLAVRRWGGTVREAGVTFMLFMPVPYVDASAANAFAKRRQRIAVSAAGIACELGVAALALPLWLWLEAGVLRDTAFVTLAIAGVSTVLFNANPLQRLDGYYICCDAMQLPNLAPRSRSWWLDLLARRLLRLPGAEAMPVAPGERRWLAAYAPLAWLTSLAIGTLGVFWLGHLSLVLGGIAGALLGWQLLLRPMLRLGQQLRRAALAAQGTARRWRWLCVAGCASLMALLGLPWQQRTLVQGVVWPPEQAQLRADEHGVVQAVLFHDGDAVRAGDVVLQLDNAQLRSEHARQAARVGALEATLFDALPAHTAATGDARAGDARAELSAAQSELQRLDQRLAALALRARSDGRLALPQAADLPGQYLRRGSLVGQVLDESPPTVRVALPEAEARALRDGRDTIEVRLASAPAVAHDALLHRDAVGAVLQLPSAALSERHGGPVPTDPHDEHDLTPLQPVVLLDVRLRDTPRPALDRIGERAWVRIEAGRAPLAWQLVQGLRRQLLRRFNPQG